LDVWNPFSKIVAKLSLSGDSITADEHRGFFIFAPPRAPPWFVRRSALEPKLGSAESLGTMREQYRNAREHISELDEPESRGCGGATNCDRVWKWREEDF